MRVERRHEGRDQPREHRKAEAVGQASGACRGAGQGCADPQAEGQDDCRYHQAWQQLPVAELADFVECPHTGCQGDGYRKGDAGAFAQEHQRCQQQVCNACDQVVRRAIECYQFEAAVDHRQRYEQHQQGKQHPCGGAECKLPSLRLMVIRHFFHTFR